ncbi:MAG: CDP-alcohol phosphatidyltransferase family protein [Acidimicrobiia bacterium]
MNRELFNAPNTVSIIRLLCIPVFVWLIVSDNEGWAGVLLAVIGATDWVDGYLARRLNQVTEIGKLLDPIADRIAVAVAVIAGLWAGILPAWFGWALIVRELLVGLGAIYGWMHGITRLDVRWTGKVATFALYAAVSGFYIGDGFDLEWLTVCAYLVGVPGLILYYWVALWYAGDMVAARRAQPEAP